MAKIFETQLEKGSYLDKIGLYPATTIEKNIVRTDRGLAFDIIGVNYLWFITAYAGFVTSKLDVGDTFSGEIWVKFRDVSTVQHICGWAIGGDRWALGITGGELRWSELGGDEVSGGSLETNRWYHIVFTQNDSNVFSLYLDNIELTGNTANASHFGGFNFIVGANASGGSNIIGTIAKCRLYDHLLTAKEREMGLKELNAAQLVTIEKYPRHYPHSKPTDLSNEPGLVQAFNMISSNSVIVDIAGGNNCIAGVDTIQSSLNGAYFNGVNSRVYFTRWTPGKTYTICCRVKPYDLLEFDILANGSSSTNFFNINNGTTVTQRVTTGGSANAIVSYSANEWVDIVITRNGDINTIVYFNGVAQAKVLDADSDFAIREIGSRSTSSYANGEIEEILIYNYAFTEAQAIAYHNKFARRVVLIEDFRFDPVGTAVPRGWIKGTGVYTINELSSQDAVLKHLNKGTKYLQCVTAGTIAIPSKSAYGTWEYLLYKGDTTTQPSVQFVSADINFTSVGNYHQMFDTSERTRLRKESTDHVYTNTSYVNFNIWYGIKITRSKAGVFYLYIKGGSFGSDYILWNMTGGSGTNPTTDIVTKVSEYFVLDFDAGDLIANIKITEGVIQ
jgi:hypothetical protein